MKYEFAHRQVHNWSFKENAIINNTIDYVLTLNQQTVLENLATYIYKTTGIKFVAISRTLPEDTNYLQTLIFMGDGELLENVTYSIIGTPCENVLKNRISYYPTGVQEEFPDDVFLQHINVHSYMGVALCDTDQNTIGAIALLHDKTIENPGLLEHILTIIAPSLEEYLINI